MKQPIGVLVVDDHPLVRKGIRMCLGGHQEIRIVGETGNALEVESMAQALKPNVVLLDIDLPQMSGLVIARRMQTEFPEIKVLILSIHETPETIHRAIQAGAHGYFFKQSSPTELAGAVQTVFQGELYFPPEAVRSALAHSAHDEMRGNKFGLTNREQEVLVKIAEGWSNKEIAHRLGVSARTVEFHREHLRCKLNLHSAASLTRFAMAQGWVPEKIEAPAQPAILPFFAREDPAVKETARVNGDLDCDHSSLDCRVGA
jgi:two-component system nitrate/nitrite response regulator NarL